MALNKTKFVINNLLLILLLCGSAFCADDMPGMPETREPRTRNSRQPRVHQSRAEKRQELKRQRQEKAQNAQQEISENYKLIIEAVNSSTKPEKQKLAEFKKTVLRNRRYLTVLDDQQRCDYHVLAAWTYHFAGKDSKILSQAEDAQKSDPLNKNAIATRISMAILYQQYDTIIEALTQTQEESESETKGISRQQQNNQETSPEMPNMGTFGLPEIQQQDYAQQKTSYKQTGSQLEVDPNWIRIDLLAKTFDPNTESFGEVITDADANSVLCVLLWKLDQRNLDRYAIAEEANEPNEPNEPNKPESEEETPAKPAPAQPMQPEFGMGFPNMMPPQQSELQGQPTKEQIGTRYNRDDQIDPEITAFAKLFSQLSGNENLKFMIVNINGSADRETVENYLKYNPFQALIPTIVLTDFNSLDSAFIKNTDSPTLLIIDSNETVRYAGAVSGFLPKMVIQKMLSAPIKFEKVKKPESVPTSQPQPVQPPARLSPKEEIPAEPAMKVPDLKPKVVQQSDDYFDPLAEQLLGTAKSLLKVGNIMVQSHSYGKPIAMCRRVIKEYPGTKYEDQARVLLRLVPDRFHRRYKLTDEELGL
ncbi:MAG: hypothetical protein K8R02_01070 [Anaerohalosphaeraceae bacterium]|nr:hypothetical protein [Anaerohalosphaeraceae bacterium]